MSERGILGADQSPPRTRREADQSSQRLRRQPFDTRTSPGFLHWAAIVGGLIALMLLLIAQGLIRMYDGKHPATPLTFPVASPASDASLDPRPRPSEPMPGSAQPGAGPVRSVVLLLEVAPDTDLTLLGYALREREASATLIGARSDTGASTARYRGSEPIHLVERLAAVRGLTYPIGVTPGFVRSTGLLIVSVRPGTSRDAKGVTLEHSMPIVTRANSSCPRIPPGPHVLWSYASSDTSSIARLLRDLDRMRECGIRLVSLPAAASAAPNPIGLAGSWAVTVAATTLLPAVALAFWLATGLATLRAVALAAAALVHHWHHQHPGRRRPRHRRRRHHSDLASIAESGSALWPPGDIPVSVIVPAYNEQDGILPALASLVAATSDRCEIIVVDDGSTDDTARCVIEANLPRVRLIRQANGGKASALNAGLAAAQHELVVMVDGDTVVHPDAVRTLVAMAVTSPDIGAVSGNIKVANRTSLLTWWQHLEFVNGFNLDRRLYDLMGAMPTVPGALGLFRRSAVLAVGGLSLATVAEDTDLTLALLEAGYRTVYEPAAIAYTEAPATVRQLARQRFRWTYGTFQALWKHRRLTVAPGAAGTHGRRMYAYVAAFQVLLPILGAPSDVMMAYLCLTDLKVAVVSFLLVTGVQCASTALALRLDHERFLPLLAVPLQQFFFRQFLYIIVLHSLVVAAAGLPVRWQAMHRLGSGQDVLARLAVADRARQS